jgi:hypothetical protein
MSYSIAWALFALLLLIISIGKKTAAARYASLGLLGLTLTKLFIHDLSQLDQLYLGSVRCGRNHCDRGVASFLYQRFFAVTETANVQKSSVAPAP